MLAGCASVLNEVMVAMPRTILVIWQDPVPFCGIEVMLIKLTDTVIVHRKLADVETSKGVGIIISIAVDED